MCCESCSGWRRCLWEAILRSSTAVLPRQNEGPDLQTLRLTAFSQNLRSAEAQFASICYLCKLSSSEVRGHHINLFWGETTKGQEEKERGRGGFGLDITTSKSCSCNLPTFQYPGDQPSHSGTRSFLQHPKGTRNAQRLHTTKSKRYFSVCLWQTAAIVIPVNNEFVAGEGSSSWRTFRWINYS